LRAMARIQHPYRETFLQEMKQLRITTPCPTVVIALILSFLDATEIFSILTQPISKTLLVEQTSGCLWELLCTGFPWRISAKDFQRLVKTEESAQAKKWSSKKLFCQLLNFSRRLKQKTLPIAEIVEVLFSFNHAVGLFESCLHDLCVMLEDESVRREALKGNLSLLLLHILTFYSQHKRIQIECLHCVVVLARPCGGSEGMVYNVNRQSEVSTAANNNAFGKDLDLASAVLALMRMHRNCETLTAMGCWALVNLSLHKDQKEQLFSGGKALEVVIEAMRRHPNHYQVQFRAQFALINLVAPAANIVSTQSTHHGQAGQDRLKELTNLVLSSINHFKTQKEIVSRGCLVLHNLSLDATVRSVLSSLGVIPCLTQMLSSYSSDNFLCSTISKTLRRLGALDLMTTEFTEQMGAVII